MSAHKAFLSKIPFFGMLLNVIKSDPNNITVPKKYEQSASLLIKDVSNNPTQATKKYASVIGQNIDKVKGAVGSDKFFHDYIQKDKIIVTVEDYAMYFYYRLTKELKLSPRIASLLTILCTSLGGFWIVITLGRYKLTKRLADRTVELIKKKGITRTVIKTIVTILFQVGIILFMQIFLSVVAILMLFTAKGSLMKIAGSLLYIFLSSFFALVMLIKSSKGVVQAKNVIQTHKL